MTRRLWVLAGLPLIFWAHFRLVAPTNFGGFDEWLILSLVSRGIVSFPYANRPLQLLWSLPAGALGPPTPQTFFVVHMAYSCAAGILVWLLWRRLRPGAPTFAFGAAVLTLVWMPQDFIRLNAVQATTQSGFTAATLGAMVLFVESWRRRSVVLLAASVLLAFLAARCYEGVAALLVATPLLLAWMERRWSGRLAAWVSVWAAGLLVLAFLILRGMGSPQGATWQTSGLGFDPVPLHVMARLLQQFRFHLAPLVFFDWRDLLSPPPLLALGLYVLVALGLLRGAPPPDREETDPRVLGGLAVLGIAWAGLAYIVYALSAAITIAGRTQFLAAPGIAVFLSACFLLMARLAPARARQAVGATLVGAVVLIGTGHTLAMQRDWNAWGRFPDQGNLLGQLVAQAPDVRPNTLFVLMDERRAFPATFTFRHAVQYLYGVHASGYVWQGSEFLYPCAWTAAGLACEPMAAIRGPWQEPPTQHAFHELVIVRYDAQGRSSILEGWPDELPQPPPGNGYAPRARLLEAAPPG